MVAGPVYPSVCLNETFFMAGWMILWFNDKDSRFGA